MADDFDVIESAPVAVAVGGGFEVQPITIERLPAFARALRPALPMVAEIAALSEDVDAMTAADSLLELVSEHGEALAEAVAIAVAPNKAGIAAMRARVAALNPADFVLLALPVVKVNADFFARRLLPALLQARQGAKAAVTPGDGPTPSAT